MTQSTDKRVLEKAEMIKTKWENKMKEQGLSVGNNTDAYIFYRTNQTMIFEDLSDLWLLCKLAELG